MVDSEIHPGAPGPMRQQAPPVVVAIDDDPLFLLATVKALASAEIACHTATTGEAGLQLIREHRPDIVLLDILLNGQDGFAICREIRRTWSPEELPVIMITGLEDMKPIRTAYESGANDFLAKPVHWTHLPYRILHVLRANRDITERRRMEEALRRSERFLREAQEAGGIGCFRLDLERGIWESTATFDGIFGIGPDYPRDTSSWLDLVAPEAREEHWRHLLELVQGRGQFHLEFQIFKKDNGQERWVSGQGSLEVDAHGLPARLVGTMLDITERRMAELEILRLNQNLEQRVKERTVQLEVANKEMEAFSYSVSHDLRAPLRGIDGFSQALLEGCGDQLDGEGKHYLQRIRLGTQRMGSLIDDLLKLSKTSRSEMTVADCDLSRLCIRVAGALGDLDPERRVEVSIQAGMRAQADPHLMLVALENLLGNARKYTSKSRDPRIEVGESGSPGQERAFFIRDNGAGFDMAHADKLFNAFQRLHGVADFEGTGIGLAIVQRIIHRHGGRIWAEAEVGKGATFFFTLPERGGS